MSRAVSPATLVETGTPAVKVRTGQLTAIVEVHPQRAGTQRQRDVVDLHVVVPAERLQVVEGDAGEGHRPPRADRPVERRPRREHHRAHIRLRSVRQRVADGVDAATREAGAVLRNAPRAPSRSGRDSARGSTGRSAPPRVRKAAGSPASGATPRSRRGAQPSRSRPCRRAGSGGTSSGTRPDRSRARRGTRSPRADDDGRVGC